MGEGGGVMFGQAGGGWGWGLECVDVGKFLGEEDAFGAQERVFESTPVGGASMEVEWRREGEAGEDVLEDLGEQSLLDPASSWSRWLGRSVGGEVAIVFALRGCWSLVAATGGVLG